MDNDEEIYHEVKAFGSVLGRTNVWKSTKTTFSLKMRRET